MSDDELRAWALSVQRDHDPAHQPHTYPRCQLCGFVRHPCDTYELAGSVVELLDRLEVLADS